MLYRPALLQPLPINKENIIDLGTKFRVKTEKTGELVVIPLLACIRAILDKYNGMPPPTISNEKTNACLKEVGENVEYNKPFMTNFVSGGKMPSESHKKNELITTHTAQRLFATNAYLADVPTISIMKITGHRSERAFIKYIKKEELIATLLNADISNKNKALESMT